MGALAVLVVAVVLALVVALLVRGGDDGDGLARARAMVDDDDRFGTAYEAGDAFAVIGQLLQEDGEACRRDDGGTSERCARLLAASAAAQVMAYRVLDCTAPGRFDARTDLAEHLDALASGDDPGDPPGAPDCD